MSAIPDKFLIKERFDIPGGGSIEIHDSRFLPTFLEINEKMKKETVEFHNRLMGMGVKAYRCNDGWVNRDDHYVTFFSDDKEVGYYWGNKDLTESMLTKKQKLLRFFGMFDDRQLQTEI